MNAGKGSHTQDLNLGFRQLRKIPFTIAAVRTLALGMVANAPVFTCLSACFINLLRCVPGIRDLTTVRRRTPGSGQAGISWLDCLGCKSRNETLVAFAIVAKPRLSLGEGTQPIVRSSESLAKVLSSSFQVSGLRSCSYEL